MLTKVEFSRLNSNALQWSPDNQGKEESETRDVDVPWKLNQPTLSTNIADADQNVDLPLCPEKVGAVLLP